jgi:DNA invertase Pin-like site-specific DNA recombinase
MIQIRCAIYCRVSVVNKGQTTDNQLLELREFALRQGWVVTPKTSPASVRIVTNLMAMFAAASRRRKFDLLLFWSMDRLSPEGVVATLQYLQRPSSYGVAFVACRQREPEPPMAGFELALIAFTHGGDGGLGEGRCLVP